MRRVTSILLAILCFGCPGIPEDARDLDTFEQRAANLVWNAWERLEPHGLPDQEQCKEHYSKYKLLVSDPGQFQNYCGRCASSVCEAGCALKYGCAAGCFLIVGKGHFGRDTPMAVIDKNLSPAKYLRVIQHETGHLLSGCAKGYVDHKHEDELIWGTNGVLDIAYFWLEL